MRKKELAYLIFLLIALIAINYSWMDKWTEKNLDNSKYIHVDRIIDGDTIESNGSSIRLLGINTPERKEKYYEEAKKYLENSILNKTVRIESKEKDLYKRDLAYVFLGEENVNEKLIQNGLANPYFPSGEDKYSDSFYDDWNKCLQTEINLCKKSDDKCSLCVNLEKFDYKNEIIILKNNCNFECDLTGWDIKDEGRKHFVFPNFILENGEDVSIIVGDGENNHNELFWKGEEYVWTDSGDSIHIRDKNGGLIFYKNY